MDIKIVPAEIVLADELCKDPSQFRSKCVRVLGKVESIDPRENTAKLSTGGVVIDLVMAGSVKVGSLYQFIGTVLPSLSDDDIVVRARLAWSVDGLDVALYKQALHARRDFLATLT